MNIIEEDDEAQPPDLSDPTAEALGLIRSQVEDTPTAAGLLRQAAEIIGRAARMLDTAEERCDHCRGKHFRNDAQARAYLGISQTPQKLRLVATKLDEAERVEVGR